MSYPAVPEEPEHPAPPGVRPFLRDQPPAAEQPAPGEQTTSLRPFVITAGRVASVDPGIGLETQVSARPGAMGARLTPEQRAIVHLCGRPLSVAEISAKLRLHFGVTRILVGDLRAAGHLDVHVLQSDFPDPDTIMRVIRGLRSIS
ncbi:DUF742 domain-containing protein [Actinoplanes sp. N902-109]|uniref:DUF742 domain-containing protein n=1 Tax=Actinoplanes sp. (strain N902-109) TaxID=649831 RepID=UPI00032963FF|nr:DUF742 domain-containing protein [Actinoplanes sp. N902-109]AGL21494.1 hypothetical protein L083_7984 [Actinoplanes sp. N902-109]